MFTESFPNSSVAPDSQDSVLGWAPWTPLLIGCLAFALLLVCRSIQAANLELPEQIAISLGQNALTNTLTMDILTELTTDIGPRLTGTDAEKRAATWAKERFEKSGFDKVWIESFLIEHGWARGLEKAEVVTPAPQPLVVSALGGSVPTPPDGIEAEIAVFKTYDALLASPTGALRGKIAVVTQKMGSGSNAMNYGTGSRIRTAGPSEAARRGAVAFLLRSLGTDNHRVAHTGVMHYTGDAPRIPAAALSVPDAEQIDRLAAKGNPVRIKLLLTPHDLGPVTSQNVVAEIRGRESPNEVVLIGAHLDSWDLGTGALDDGAGVAIVMSASKLIHDLPQRPRRTLRVVLYGAEEIGLIGGKAYAEAHKAELEHYIIVAEPDSGQGLVERFQTGVADPDEPSLKRIRDVLATFGVSAGNNLSHGSSDVEPLAEAGVPAVTMTPGGNDYFDIHHTPDDTLDKIKPERINQSTATYAAFAYLAAELQGHYRSIK